MKGSAIIQYSNSNCNCFAVINFPIRRTTSNITVLVIETEGGSKHFLSVSGTQNIGYGRLPASNAIQIHGKLGKAMQLREGDRVLFHDLEDLPGAVATVKLSCCSRDDWEILETNAEFVSDNILSQLRVVYPGQAFPVWLSKSMAINLKIDEITPFGESGLLVSNTQLIIPSIAPTSNHVLPNALLKHQKVRVHPFFMPPTENLLPTEALLVSNIFHGFTYRAHVNLTESDSSEDIYVEIVSTEDEKKELMTIRLLFLDSIDSKILKAIMPLVTIPCIYFHPKLLSTRQQQLTKQSWVWISAANEDRFRQMQTKSSTDLSESLIEKEEILYSGFQSCLGKCTDFVKASLSLRQGTTRHNFTGPEYGSLLIEGPAGSGKTSLAVATAQSLSKAPYYIEWEHVSCAKLRGKKSEAIEKEITKSLINLECKQPSLLILDDLDVLIPSAKTEELNRQEEFQHFKLSETLIETLMKHKKNRLAIICTAVSGDTLNAYWKSRPGFHFIQESAKLRSPTESERMTIFMACVKRYLKNSELGGLSLIPLAADAEAVTAAQFNPNPNQIDNNEEGNKGQLNTSSLQRKGATRSTSSDDVASIMGRSLESDEELTKQIAIALGAIHEQNATPQFLVSVAKKWGTYLRSMEQNVVAGRWHVSPSGGGGGASGTNNITANEDVNEQIKAFNEILEEEIRFSVDLDQLKRTVREKPLSWDAIGGLSSVKHELKKILEWPIKFPQYFKNSPIRLPCGILFYGYPGTGKTLMGLAIQSIVNVKFMHVKGPELLSKYIGASEQAVQDVFARARDSRPCIIFFDEFDSLVPRRGHDTTGVTDRVVNQFLSEMDGVDGGMGEGVYLIAATSRPDLIDPAVLRPGRLDKHLFFNLPTESDRKEILKAISSQVNFKLESESEWDEICKLTEGFTGADLNSVMFSAQLAAVQEYLGTLNNRCDKLEERGSSSAAASSSTQEIQVSRESLIECLKDFKPSVQGQELRKFKALYEGFIFSKSGGAKELSTVVGTKLADEEGEEDKVWKIEPGKRATLA